MMAAIYEDAGTADVFDIPNGDATDDTFHLPCSDRIYMYYVDAEGTDYAAYEAALTSGDTAAADDMWGMVYNRPFVRIVGVARPCGARLQQRRFATGRVDQCLAGVLPQVGPGGRRAVPRGTARRSRRQHCYSTRGGGMGSPNTHLHGAAAGGGVPGVSRPGKQGARE